MPLYGTSTLPLAHSLLIKPHNKNFVPLVLSSESIRLSSIFKSYVINKYVEINTLLGRSMVGGVMQGSKKRRVSVGLFSTFRHPLRLGISLLSASFPVTVTALLTTTTGTLLSTTLQRIFSTDSSITTRRFIIIINNAHFKEPHELYDVLNYRPWKRFYDSADSVDI
jgi:hypothetical protein